MQHRPPTAPPGAQLVWLSCWPCAAPGWASVHAAKVCRGLLETRAGRAWVGWGVAGLHLPCSLPARTQLRYPSAHRGFRCRCTQRSGARARCAARSCQVMPRPCSLVVALQGAHTPMSLWHCSRSVSDAACLTAASLARPCRSLCVGGGPGCCQQRAAADGPAGKSLPPAWPCLCTARTRQPARPPLPPPHPPPTTAQTHLPDHPSSAAALHCRSVCAEPLIARLPGTCPALPAGGWRQGILHNGRPGHLLLLRADCSRWAASSPSQLLSSALLPRGLARPAALPGAQRACRALKWLCPECVCWAAALGSPRRAGAGPVCPAASSALTPSARLPSPS